MSNDKPGTPQGPDDQKDEDAIAFAEGLFELARNGGAGPLSVILNAGVPVDMRTSSGDTLLMLACSNGHADTARLLLENGANPELRNDQLQTPLMAAARSNQGAVIECLLEAGAQKALADGEGRSALDLAISKGAEEAIRALS
ncbi:MULTISPECIES: ankyrin repeat domain-containing protein [Marinobacter]|uniref:ankyrin repeat domain-containing protein n=1 Tax=Marinobacter TaxID=2742 RepID=UPI001246B4FD|nr:MULTISPECIES: ankyrin repeat domain-containing protein [Marinobacter]MBL3556334.1 ankyrin repeat domain-containing protein [Marinobacter sp. JB05H06]